MKRMARYVLPRLALCAISTKRENKMSDAITKEMVEQLIQAEEKGDIQQINAILKKDTCPQISHPLGENMKTVQHPLVRTCGSVPNKIIGKNMLSENALLLDKLLVHLHTEIREGRGDDKLADDIRDNMDKPWHSLNSEELKIHNEASGDLYQIGKDEILKSLEEGETIESNTLNVMSNFLDKNWKATLEALRKPSNLDRLQILKMRATCYYELGYKATAYAFDSAFRAEETI